MSKVTFETVEKSTKTHTLELKKEDGNVFLHLDGIVVVGFIAGERPECVVWEEYLKKHDVSLIVCPDP